MEREGFVRTQRTPLDPPLSRLCGLRTIAGQQLLPSVERVQALGDISRSGYVVTATKLVHRLQIRSIGLVQN